MRGKEGEAMAKRIYLRAMSEEEQRVLARLSASRKAASGLVKRATMVVRYSAGHSCRPIGRDLHVDEETVSRWVHRFVDGGLDGLRDEARSGRPLRYTVEEVSLLIQTALTSPQELGLPFGSWTLDRLQASVQEEQGLNMKRSRMDEMLLKEGLRWRKQEWWFGVRVDPDFAQKRGPLSSSTRGRRPRASSYVSINEAQKPGKKNLGKEVVSALGKEERPVQRAKVEVDYTHHGKGYVCGAFRPATGEAFTACSTSRTAKNWIEFLEQVDAWVGPEVKQVYAILDNVGMHTGTNALLFALAHPRWECVFQPTRAAYLN
jgi:transposase